MVLLIVGGVGFILSLISLIWAVAFVFLLDNGLGLLPVVGLVLSTGILITAGALIIGFFNQNEGAEHV